MLADLVGAKDIAPDVELVEAAIQPWRAPFIDYAPCLHAQGVQIGHDLPMGNTSARRLFQFSVKCPVEIEPHLALRATRDCEVVPLAVVDRGLARDLVWW